ncbi:hypothetical protein CMI47_23455 [Candidatus Pacearchaeota archaeon]|nr:hypothetical protein [Candidatus Pacearchaeota archaeon]
MSNIRPEMLLPDFEFYSKSPTGWEKLPTCNSHGTLCSEPAPHARVEQSLKNLYVKLPTHRMFIQLGIRNSNREVTGYVRIPASSCVMDMYKFHFRNKAIVEVDLFQILKSSKYLKEGDINNKLVPAQKTYLLTGTLQVLRGSEVASVTYAEARGYDWDYTQHIGPLLREIGGLRYTPAALEQACRSIQMKRAVSHAPSFPGSQVLRQASNMNSDTKFLVRY